MVSCCTCTIYQDVEDALLLSADQCLLRAGFTADQLFAQGVTYTYDDVIFHPGYIDFGAHEVSFLSVLVLR